MKIAQIVLRYLQAICGGSIHVKYIVDKISRFKDASVDIYTSFLINQSDELLSLPSVEKNEKIRIFRHKLIKIYEKNDTL